jgi:Tol biopolymer transport system component
VSTPRRGVALGMVVGVASMLLTPSALAYYSRPGVTERVSVSSTGSQASGNSGRPVITPDGRYVAFESIAGDLVSGVDTRGQYQIYVHDRHTGDTEIVSISNQGEASNQWATRAAISADGRYVVFHTNATNLVPQSTVSWQIYLHDRVTGETELMSRTQDGIRANRSSTNPTISADGRYVAFRSFADNLVPGTSRDRMHIYLVDRTSHEVELISRAPDGTEAGGDCDTVRCGDSMDPAITPDGRFVAYNSFATNLVDGPVGPGTDVFLHDRETGETDHVSVATDGTTQDKGAWAQTISADGRFVAFESTATNLVPSRFWDAFHVYLHDRDTGVTERISVSSDGVEGDGGGMEPVISGNGRYVAYMSFAFNLTPEEELNVRPDIYVYDRHTGETEKITVRAEGTDPCPPGPPPPGAACSDSGHPGISNDGRYVVFESLSRNLIPDDTNERRDVFVRDRGPATGVGALSVAPEGNAASVAGWATFSGTIVSAAEAETTALDPVLREADAAITGARVVHRAEREDLLFHTELDHLSRNIEFFVDRDRVLSATVPAMVYGWTFDAGGNSWEIRVQRVALSGAPDAMPWDHGVKLFRCLPACVPVTSLRGGIGAVGASIRAGVSLEALDIGPGDAIENVRAFVAPGELTAGRLVPVAELALPDAEISVPSVVLGISPAGTSESDVDFDTPAEITEGGFSGALDVSSLPDGHYEAWARACLDEACGATVRPVTLGDPVEIKETILEVTVEGRGQNIALRARLAELDDPSVGIAGRDISFYSDGELLGTEVTDAGGAAQIAVPPGHRGANRTYEAVFAGDAFYASSSATRPGRGGQGESDRGGHQASHSSRGQSPL